ncbi:uncharacterized protein EDB93DRAFT_79114 [Suillus bovinus]|uniref:uncharacterized protein n=1 Tax=Suillus bovinus TaxID=48563 RepID=UPI001B88541B|nr:uncharacterized protein EDB93DRAFT_79114 [Suillus bovinus]KAG2130439.1 hypothetical protein EDB93DRAFT_79114 [Suillus bovinus]
MIHEGFDSLFASAHTWHESHFPDTGESFWDKIIELGPNIKEYTDELFYHVVELYPSEKLAEFRQSMVNVTAAATALHKVCSGAAEDSGISLYSVMYSVMEEHGDIFIVLFEELMEMFPPPSEAPGHDNCTIMIGMALDRIEQSFLQIATKVGINEELLKSYSGSLKFVVQHVVVTIGTTLLNSIRTLPIPSCSSRLQSLPLYCYLRSNFSACLDLDHEDQSKVRSCILLRWWAAP